MEEVQEALAAALDPLPIFLGPETLVDQPELPHVVMIPISDTLSVPQKVDVDTLAAATGSTEYICRAATYQAARDTALMVLEALLPLGGQVTTATIRYGTETWSNYAVRVARLTVLTPMIASKEGITRVRVETFIQHVKLLPLTALLPQEPTHGPEPEGTTLFEQST